MAGVNAISTLITLNIIFFTCVSSHCVPCPPEGTLSAPSTTPTKAAKFVPSSKYCALVEGLAALEATLYLCTAIKANVLGIVKLEIPVALSLVINSCSKKVPQSFVYSYRLLPAPVI
ncbi:hypothetical protein Pfo_010161 [Paulownia fortunei]|nr:hypothetical protein Pfo_010161 [Paulownia fortunei]